MTIRFPAYRAPSEFPFEATIRCNLIRRNEKWRQHYYDLFAKAKTERFSFEQIITELYRLTGNVEASFSSKMLATIDASKPIWDQYVLQNLGLELMG